MTAIPSEDAEVAISRMALRIAYLEEENATWRARAEKAEQAANEWASFAQTHIDVRRCRKCNGLRAAGIVCVRCRE